jgi:2-polyprenyl-3-methyl-5-hydroxy-6-metoxy-1,4-benzoquinol methylase
MAAPSLPPETLRIQVDLMNLEMRDQWDIAFLLDVIEHLPDDVTAIQQAHAALKRGGYHFVTTPAFPQFWSYNDEIAHHQRRYIRKDYALAWHGRQDSYSAMYVTLCFS